MKSILPLLLFLCINSKTSATIIVTVNGQANGSTFEQGTVFNWNISGLTNGASVFNQFWIDKNSNGTIEPATDLLFVSFNQTDGNNNNQQGPGDQDASANGTIATTIGGLSFPAANYIFKVKSGTDSATSTFTMTTLLSYTYYVSGKVTLAASGVADVTIRLEDRSTENEYYVLTDADGNYIVYINSAPGTEVRLEVPKESFNDAFGNYITSPADTSFIINSNVTDVNFTFSSAKIITGHVTDTLGNPIPDMAVNVYKGNGGNGYDGRTDINGNYFIAVDTGSYTVQFGRDEEPKRYIRTYYNQKYLSNQSNLVNVTLLMDTVKNIDAVLRQGALIMGTFKKDGQSIRGGISVYLYNVGGPPVYEAFHDDTQEFYYLFVPPGTYSIQFHQENGGGQGLFYNQTPDWPGIPVNLNTLSDTAKNINVDFTSPLTYEFTGNGNWGNRFNWKDNLRPPFTLYAPDSILINHTPGGQCILNYTQHISNGATLTVPTGKNLVVPGLLRIE